mmetsp:Transcript_136441/g.345481  ORF Transcript_136441/g.345481 Transcript_136441/m.345481 type:complete len:242 (+) Transcript_136441:427-1152(+)
MRLGANSRPSEVLDGEDAVRRVHHNLITISRVEADGIIAVSEHLLCAHGSVARGGHVSHLAKVDLGLDDETQVRVRTDGLVVGLPRLYRKVDAAPAPAQLARLEAPLKDKRADLGTGLVVQGQDFTLGLPGLVRAVPQGLMRGVPRQLVLMPRVRNIVGGCCLTRIRFALLPGRFGMLLLLWRPGHGAAETDAASQGGARASERHQGQPKHCHEQHVQGRDHQTSRRNELGLSTLHSHASG